MIQKAPPPSKRHEGVLVRLIENLSRVCGVLSAAMIFISVVITCQMIWVRFVLGESTIWQTEAVTYLMIAATLIGLPYVQLLKGHVNVDLLPLMLPSALQKWLALFTLALSAIVIGFMAFHGFELFHTALSRGWKSDSVWGVAMWIPYLAMPVGFGLYVLQLLADMYATLRGDEAPFEHSDLEEDY